MVSNIANLKVKLFYIGSIVAIFGHAVDAFFIETNQSVFILNIFTLGLILLLTGLIIFTKFSINLANAVIIYSVLANTILSILLKSHTIDIEVIFFQSALLYGVLILYTGFALKRIHLGIISLIYISFYLFIALNNKSHLLLFNMPIIFILIFSYLFGMNFIVKILNRYNSEQTVFINNLKEINQLLEEKGIELNKLNSTKDKLLSILGHDLRTPANSIMGFAELIKLKSETVESKTIKEYSSLIYESSSNLNILISQILDWAILQSGKIAIKKKDVNVDLLIKDVLDLMQGAIYLKNIKVDYSNKVTNSITADKEMISTIIRNLVNNALKYTPKNGSVSINSYMQNSNYIFELKDSGIGMDENTLNSLFLEVLVESSPGTENEKGTGLGIVICRDYIKLHKGKIWAESELNKGTTFSFSIPTMVNP